MARTKAPPISNLALAGVLAVAAIALSVLGGLFYSLHHRAVSQPAVAQEPEAAAGGGASVSVVVKSDEEEPVIRVVLRPEQIPDAPLRVAIASDAVKAPIPTILEAEGSREKSDAAPEAPVLSASQESNELIPDISGSSYTARKAMSNPAEPNARPARRPDIKKPEPKKIVPLVPPKSPAKVEPAKPAAPPALPPLDPKRVDISKAPVYVLNDGRRIRALAVRENGMMITVKNEAGTDITFKKSDVKQILRG